MNFDTYLLNQRNHTIDPAYALNYEFQQNKNYLFDLSYLSCLAVEGERAAEFLQGQVSCDVRLVTEQKMQQGVLCNLQGRILAMTDVINWQGFRLILPLDLISETQASLAMTAMVSRVKLRADKTYQLYGFYLQNENNLLPPDFTALDDRYALKQTEDSCYYHLGDHFYIFLATPEKAKSIMQSFADSKQYHGSLAWHRLRLAYKAIELYPETRALFLPHKLDLHLSGYLSFDKGCYKGQEIIARTHYKAKLKHGLQVFLIETTELLQAGKRIFDESKEREIGELVDFSPLGENRYLIAVSILVEHNSTIRIGEHLNPVTLNPV